MPIQTYVMEYNDEMVREAVHQGAGKRRDRSTMCTTGLRISRMWRGKIQQLVPEAKCSLCTWADEGERAGGTSCMIFINGDIDVLVSTTIIETGA